MKIKLPRTDRKVIVNEKTGTVTTLLVGIDNPAMKFVGVAQCSPEDTFNVEIGTRMSYRRAKRAFLQAIRNEVRFEIVKGEKYAKMHKEIYDDLTKYIDELKTKTYEEV